MRLVLGTSRAHTSVLRTTVKQRGFLPEFPWFRRPMIPSGSPPFPSASLHVGFTSVAPGSYTLTRTLVVQ